MTARPVKNVPASVRQRLLNLAREREEDFQLILIRYGIERLLFRLAGSPYRARFLLKGAMLFAAWAGAPHRPTRDLDLMGEGESDVEALVDVFRDLCAQWHDDGIEFDPESVVGEEIHGNEEYQGVRITLEGELAGARITVRVDVGFGHAVTPGPEDITYPTLLDHPAPELAAYPPETVIAEKFQAMVQLGIGNSRMKDFYDLWVFSERFPFTSQRLGAAIEATFTRRDTPLPMNLPICFSDEFATDAEKQGEWAAFVDRSGLSGEAPNLDEVIGALRLFLLPIAEARSEGRPLDAHWPRGGPWSGSEPSGG